MNGVHETNVKKVIDFLTKNAGTAYTYEELSEELEMVEGTVRSIIRQNKDIVVRKVIGCKTDDVKRAYVMIKVVRE